MARLATLALALGLMAALPGCIFINCSPCMDHYGDLIDDIGEMQPELDDLYSPYCDLSRIGMPDWCSCPFNCWWGGCACYEARAYTAKYGLWEERCGCRPGIYGCGRCMNGRCNYRPPLHPPVNTNTETASPTETAPAPQAIAPEATPDQPPALPAPAAPQSNGPGPDNFKMPFVVPEPAMPSSK